MIRAIVRWWRGPVLPPPHHTTVPRPWRYHTTHWNRHAGHGARS